METSVWPKWAVQERQRIRATANLMVSKNVAVLLSNLFSTSLLDVFLYLPPHFFPTLVMLFSFLLHLVISFLSAVLHFFLRTYGDTASRHLDLSLSISLSICIKVVKIDAKHSTGCCGLCSKQVLGLFSLSSL